MPGQIQLEGGVGLNFLFAVDGSNDPGLFGRLNGHKWILLSVVAGSADGQSQFAGHGGWTFIPYSSHAVAEIVA
jgi:hypothetical protein